MKMGLPVDKLVIATNVNDILARTLETGRYEMRGVMPTIAPSMDIQVSSNFERLLSEVTGRDGDAVRRMMNQLGQSGSFTLEDGPLEEMRAAVSPPAAASEEETSATIADSEAKAGYLLDPHTAIGVHVANSVRTMRRKRRWWCWGPPIRRNSRMRWKRPAACGRICRKT
jgi:threonine synthase